MLRFFLSLILMCCVAVMAPVGSDAAVGSGYVSTISNRYVMDAGGTPKFLIGYYGWNSVDNASLIDHPMSYQTILSTGDDYGINYLRVSLGVNRFTASTSPASYDGTTTRTPFAYTGSPAKADLDAWDSTFWNSLKALAADARSKNILLHVSIFDSVGFNVGTATYRWSNSFWNVANQKQSFYGNLDRDANGGAHQAGEFYDLDAFNNGTGIGYYQKRLIDKATSELNSYENVFFEMGNELSESGTSWHDTVLTYTRTKTSKLVTSNTCERYLCITPSSPGMYVRHVAESVSELKSGLESIVGSGYPVMEDPDGIIYFKTGSLTVRRQAAWTSFVGGAAGWGGFTFEMDTGANTDVLTMYKHLQDFISTTGIRFWEMTPQQSHISPNATNSLLALSAVEYLGYAKVDASITITLASGHYTVRYYNPATGVFTTGAEVDGGARTFNRPSGASDWVVYLKSATPGSPRNPGSPRSLSITM